MKEKIRSIERIRIELIPAFLNFPMIGLFFYLILSNQANWAIINGFAENIFHLGNLFHSDFNYMIFLLGVLGAFGIYCGIYLLIGTFNLKWAQNFILNLIPIIFLVIMVVVFNIVFTANARIDYSFLYFFLGIQNGMILYLSLTLATLFLILLLIFQIPKLWNLQLPNETVLFRVHPKLTTLTTIIGVALVVPIMLLFVFYCPPTKVYWDNIFIIQARWFSILNAITGVWIVTTILYWGMFLFAAKFQMKYSIKIYYSLILGCFLVQILCLLFLIFNLEFQAHNTYQWTGIGFFANFWLGLITYMGILPLIGNFIKKSTLNIPSGEIKKKKTLSLAISLIILVLPPFWLTFYQPLVFDAPNADVTLNTTIKQINGVSVPFQGSTVYPSFELQSPLSHQYYNLNGIWKVKDMGTSPLDSLAPRTERILEKFTSDGFTELNFDDSTWEDFQVPKSYINEGDGKNYGVLWYRKTFTVTESYLNNSLLLKFIAVNYLCDIWLDGNYLGYHEGSYYPFAFDITDRLSVGTHILAVRVDNPMNNPLFAKRIVPDGGDSFFFEGLVRDVYIEIAPKASINRVDYRITNLSTSNNQTASIEMDTNIIIRVPENYENTPATLQINAYPLIFNDNTSLSSQNTWEFIDWQSSANETINKSITLTRAEGTNYAVFQYHVIYDNVKLWSTKHPNLYALIVNLTIGGESSKFDMFCTQIGFRTIEVVGESILLNKAPVILAGLTYVEMRAAPLGISLSFQDYFEDFILMNQTFTNYLRTGNLHPQAYLLADRFGMTIWEESPFNWFNDLNYYMCFSRNLIDAIWTEIVFRNINRPSVIYYGACNEPWSTIGLFKYLPYMTEWMGIYDPSRILSFSAASSQDWNPAFNYLPSVTPNTYGGTFEGERYAWDIEIKCNSNKLFQHYQNESIIDGLPFFKFYVRILKMYKKNTV